jgi:hypothetical protein
VNIKKIINEMINPIVFEFVIKNSIIYLSIHFNNQILAPIVITVKTTDIIDIVP